MKNGTLIKNGAITLRSHFVAINQKILAFLVK